MLKSVFPFLGALLGLTFCATNNAHTYFPHEPISGHATVATYSIVAWDSITGDLGVAVQSKFLAVGAVVPYGKAGVGVVATQAWANTAYGPRGLQMLESGISAQQVVEALIQSDTSANQRQVAIVDARGNAFAYTGAGCQPWAGHITGRGYAVQGNILAGEAVLKAMARTFESTAGALAERLIVALDAGEKEGGDKRGRQSAALLVVREKGGYSGYNDRFVDIRVDDNPDPIAELRRIYKLWISTLLPEAERRTVAEFNREKNYIASQQELQRFVERLNAELRERPDDPDVMNRIAWTLATNDLDLPRAMELAKRAAKLRPTDPKILNTLAECHYRSGNFDEAIAIESELVSKDPTNDSFWRQLQKFKEAKQKAGR